MGKKAIEDNDPELKNESNIDVHQIVTNELEKFEQKYLDRLKYLLIGLGLFVTVITTLINFTGVGKDVSGFFVKKMVLAGLSNRAALSYEKAIPFTEGVKSGSIKFYSERDQMVSLRCEVSSRFGNQKSKLNIRISLDGVDITKDENFSSLVEQVSTGIGGYNYIKLDKYLNDNIDNRDVHELKFEYLPTEDDSAREVLIHCLVIVKDK